MIKNQSLIEIDAVINQIVKSLDPATFSYCKDYFEKNLLYLYGDKLEMVLIVDAQAVISDAIAHIEKGKSFLLELLKSPFLKVYSPTWLREEVNKKIPEIAERRGINGNDLRRSVYAILEKIQIVDLENEMAYTRASASVGYRHPKDIPYVALHFSIRSHGILTKDKHITEIPEIKTWEKPGIVGKVVSVFEKGTFSFLIVGKTLPSVFRSLCEICAGLLRIVWGIIQIVGNAIYSLIKKGIAAISKWPDWVKALICVGIVVALLWEKSRKVITDVVQSFVSVIIAIFNWFYEGLKNVISIIAPFVEISIGVLAVLFTSIEKTITTYKQLTVV
jgi:predicted nucleic acid-binding protein